MATKYYYTEVIERTDYALKGDERNIKARYRKATAQERLRNIEAVLDTVRTALELDLENVELEASRRRLTTAQRPCEGRRP